MQIHSVGIDLGKTTFHLVALGDNGKVPLTNKFTQRQLIIFTANLQATVIGLEACSVPSVRDRLITRRRSVINQLRAFLLEPAWYSR